MTVTSIRLDPRVIEDRALSYLALGLSIFLLPQPDDRHDGKTPATSDRCGVARCHPVISWREYQHRLASPSEIRGWIDAQLLNLAIVTGLMSRIIAVDLDSPAAIDWGVRQLPYTPWQTRSARGYHLFYRHPGIQVPNRARVRAGQGRLAIDVRGDGGYVIAAGSLHSSGIVYIEAGDWSEAAIRLPVFRSEWLERRDSDCDIGSVLTRPLSTADSSASVLPSLAAVPPDEDGVAR